MKFPEFPNINILANFSQNQVFKKSKIPFEIKLWNGRLYHFGEGDSLFRVIVNNQQALASLNQLDELKISESYINGSLDIAGNMIQAISMRNFLIDYHPWFRSWKHIVPMVIGQTLSDRQAIAQHYDFDTEFYLKFLGSTRCYSQALFEHDNESLEEAQYRKFDFAIETCHLKQGDRVLDVGGCWGAFTEYAGKQGIQVTSLTISQQSMQFLTELIEKLNLPCKAINQHFLEYKSVDCYDAIMLFGVIEHLPDYSAVLKQCQRLLKPGGRVYLDASASRQKYQVSTFINRYIYPRNHSFFCLCDYLTDVAKSPFELHAIYNDRHSYFLTCKAWAKNLETAHDEIIHLWSKSLYRTFHLYLWGASSAFLHRSLEAYRVILELPRTTS
jgi:cyclopropane-fatty-acyl-phospholipid synthase